MVGTISAKLRSALDNARRRATQKRLPIDIDIAFVLALWDRQQGRCALSGRTLLCDAGGEGGTLRAGESLRDSPSLDQIVPGAGYTAENVQLVTTQCNLAKSTLSSSEFEDLCEQVYFTGLRRKQVTGPPRPPPA